ncbi:hypothetical protein Patl1_27469 [Pistacia atlantica]|uniref:Uncharacterized protein n=1 Tax=Pistacia atlantica TaxID=434234 RepID=A0ACC1BDM5_9ROSI|nr:hypothetical protein Patl1_27469 [Pistacia atlantica]
MSWTWNSLALVALAFFLQAFLWKKDSKTKRLPPGLTCRMVFGKKYADVELDERGFNTLIHEGANQANEGGFQGV